MAFGRIREAAPRAGKLYRFEIDTLPGSPVVHLEHLGDGNRTLLAAEIAAANAPAPKKQSKKGPRKIDEAFVDEFSRKQRDDLARHAIRRLEAVHDDGTPATDADIPDFVEALPLYLVRMLHAIASDLRNYLDELELPQSSPEDLGGK